jgi:ABC-type transport system substrate-binding protein
LRVRQAANYAINREDVKELLGGLMEDAYSTIPPATPYFGHPVLYKFDPKKAHALLEEAKCLPCNVTFVISTSGSGQMQPLQMNELIKSQMEEVGFRVKLDIMDWNALGQGSERSVLRADPPRGEIAMGAGGEQLGPLRRRRDRGFDHQDQCRVRPDEAQRVADQVERADERPGGDDLGGA